MQRYALKLSVLALFALAALIPGAQADVPRLMAWQGVALDSNNVPVTDSTYGFTFRIYDDGIGGNLLWSESQLVTTENGVLNVLLGSTNPIPDSVFAGPDRYLEVQFAAEPPYTPRTQIVSVGYAYRVATVDGATGGTISTDLKLQSPFMDPALRVFREGMIEPAAILGSTTEGGQLLLYDEANNYASGLYPGPTGTGGALLVITDTFGGKGISMAGAYGTENPGMIMVGDSSSVEFYMGTSGDPAVQLPYNSIGQFEIANEAGLAAGPASSASLTTTYATAASATANFPADGYAVIICQGVFRAATSNNYLSCWLNDSLGLTSWYWDPGDVDSPTPWYDQAQQYVYTSAVTAGLHTYTLDIRCNSGTAHVEDAKITVMYFPTAYGTVSAPSAPRNIDDPLIQQATSISNPVDVEAERQASIRANQERIERELTQIKERMIRLEAELQRTAELRSEKR